MPRRLKLRFGNQHTGCEKIRPGVFSRHQWTGSGEAKQGGNNLHARFRLSGLLGTGDQRRIA